MSVFKFGQVCSSWSEINKRNKKLRPSILRFCAMFHGLHAWNPSTTQCVITFNMSHQRGWPVDEAARPPILVSKKQVDSQTFDHASVRCSQARGTQIRRRFWPLWTVGRFWTSMVHLEQWQLLALIWWQWLGGPETSHWEHADAPGLVRLDLHHEDRRFEDHGG